MCVGLQRQLETMIKTNAHIQANDPEVELDVRALSETLLKNYRDLSTFERWVSEVQSGKLPTPSVACTLIGEWDSSQRTGQAFSFSH